MSVSRLVACVELITLVLLTRASPHMYTAVLHADVQNDNFMSCSSINSCSIVQTLLT